jgi:hypothetical protein
LGVGVGGVRRRRAGQCVTGGWVARNGVSLLGVGVDPANGAHCVGKARCRRPGDVAAERPRGLGRRCRLRAAAKALPDPARQLASLFLSLLAQSHPSSPGVPSRHDVGAPQYCVLLAG